MPKPSQPPGGDEPRPQSSKRPPRRRIRGAGRRAIRLPPIPWHRLVYGLLALVLLGATFYYYGDIETVHREARRIDGPTAFALLTLLPLVGFPVSVLHVAAGIRFGGKLGLALVALSILLQLLASYAIVRAWRDRLDRSRWLRAVRAQLPKGAHSSLCVLGVLLPGAPYAAINYTLPLIGVPLRTCLAWCLPLHVLRSTITVFLGDQSDRLTAPRLAVLAGYALLVAAASLLTYRRVRAQLAGPPQAEDGRRQPA